MASGQTIGSLLGTGASFATGIPGLGAVGGALGGMFGGDDDAEDAMSQQIMALARAERNQRKTAQQNRRDILPYLQTGQSANSTLASLMGINPQVSAAGREDMLVKEAQKLLPKTAVYQYGAGPNGEDFLDAATGMRYVLNRENGTLLQKSGSTPDAKWAMVKGSENLNSLVDTAFEAQKSQTSTDPNFGMLTKKFTMDDFNTDPGYEFRKSEGLKGLEHAQSSRGNFLSGAAIKAAQKYNQDFASNEYSNAWNRDNTFKQNTFGNLFNMSGQGLQAVGLGTNNALNSSNAIADTTAGIGDAASAGAIARMNQNNQNSATLGSFMNQFGNSQYSNTQLDPRAMTLARQGSLLRF